MKELKRTKMYILLILFAVLIIPYKANALPLCTGKTKQKYITLANSIDLKYEFNRDEYGYYFTIKASNVDKDLVIEYDNVDYHGLGGETYVVFDNHFKDNDTYKFKIKVDKGITCADETVTFKTIKIPKYNKYSESDECIEYEEAPMCSKFYKEDFKDFEEFQAKLHQYIEKTKKNSVEDYKDERSLFKKISDFYADHLVLSVTITFIIIAVIAYFIIRSIVRRSKRVKL